MSDFDPGPGWHEVSSNEVGHEENIRLETAEAVRWFVREVPVPPLPIAPYTVIRVTWRDDQRDPDEYALMVRTGTGKWAYLLTDAGTFSSDVLATLITSFEVLSESRAVTARSVLEFLQPVIPGNWARDCADSFGVSNLYVGVDVPPEDKS